VPSPAAEARLQIPAQIREAVIRHAETCRPLEACGLLAVDAGGHLRMAYPLTNAEQSATRFTIAPEEHFGALRHAEARGWRVGGVFHSHPAGGPVPSPVDLAQPHDPDWLHLVVGLSPRPQLRAWRYLGGAPVEIPVT
jgi:proteasome lid subunit RPN8/RPN11